MERATELAKLIKSIAKDPKFEKADVLDNNLTWFYKIGGKNWCEGLANSQVLWHVEKPPTILFLQPHQMFSRSWLSLSLTPPLGSLIEPLDKFAFYFSEPLNCTTRYPTPSKPDSDIRRSLSDRSTLSLPCKGVLLEQDWFHIPRSCCFTYWWECQTIERRISCIYAESTDLSRSY